MVEGRKPARPALSASKVAAIRRGVNRKSAAATHVRRRDAGPGRTHLSLPWSVSEMIASTMPDFISIFTIPPSGTSLLTLLLRRFRGDRHERGQCDESGG
jgi:hypothetical protein